MKNSRKNLSWGGYSGQLEAGFSCDGTVAWVTLWKRFTPWDDWRWQWIGRAPAILGNGPTLIVWEKEAAIPLACAAVVK